MKNKRALVLAILAVITAVGCRRELKSVRVAYSPNLSHAAIVVGLASGRMASAGGLPVQASVYNAGPAAIEALLYRDVDIAYVGPVPAISAFVRSKGGFVIVSGAAEGGAALVTVKKSTITVPGDLHNSRVATPQSGNTQDVAARSFFGELGFVSYEHGGSFYIVPTANTEMLSSLQNGAIQAAWTVEPWVTQLVQEGGGKILVDEAELWGVSPASASYTTAVVIARASLIKDNPAVLQDFLRLHAETTEWMNQNPEEAQRIAESAITKLTHRAFAPGVFKGAWERIHLTTNVSRECLEKNADHAARVGFLPPDIIDLDKLIDLRFSKGGTKTPGRS